MFFNYATNEIILLVQWLYKVPRI